MCTWSPSLPHKSQQVCWWLPSLSHQNQQVCVSISGRYIRVQHPATFDHDLWYLLVMFTARDPWGRPLPDLVVTSMSWHLADAHYPPSPPNNHHHCHHHHHHHHHSSADSRSQMRKQCTQSVSPIKGNVPKTTSVAGDTMVIKEEYKKRRKKRTAESKIIIYQRIIEIIKSNIQ